MAKRRKKREYFRCPHCGAKVRHGDLSCRHCGSDDETGWSEDADLYEADITSGYGGDGDFDYGEFVADEFPDQFTGPRRKWFWRLVAVILVILLILGLTALY